MDTTPTKYNEESDNNVPSHQLEKVAPSTHKFNCPRCGHGTDLKANMTSHLSNKKECKVLFQDISRDVILNTLNSPPKLPQMECPKCNKMIAKVNIARHNKTCRENTHVTSSEHTLQSVFTTIIDLDNYIMTKVQECVARQVDKMQVDYTIINGINITLNSFGSETTTHLTEDFLSYCILNPRKGITQLIEKIHYNTDVPENINLLFKSEKRNTFEIYKDDQWTECDASNTLDELIKKGYRILNNHYIQTFLTDPNFLENEMKVRIVERFRQLDEQGCQFYFSAKRDIRLLIKNKTFNQSSITGGLIEETK